jgi:hypothetical protein
MATKEALAKLKDFMDLAEGQVGTYTAAEEYKKKLIEQLGLEEEEPRYNGPRCLDCHCLIAIHFKGHGRCFGFSKANGTCKCKEAKRVTL